MESPSLSDSGTTRVSEPLPERSEQQRLGTTFSSAATPEKIDLSIDRIDLPDFPGTFAVWGAIGRTDNGDILTGVSTVWTKDAPRPSARVFRYDPATDSLASKGDVMANLDRLGLAREERLPLKNGRIAVAADDATPTQCRECQMKVHSKFVTLDDGYTYFASMDEWNEHEDGSQLPYWGSHVWRMRPGQKEWKHLIATPDAVIAADGVGRYLYLLGYFDHVVHCFDTVTGRWKRKVLGSYGGHISRNLVVDARGHAFVPRVSELPAGDGGKPTYRTELVELDEQLNEIHATELLHYPVTGNASSHGIVGFARLSDGRTAFTTSSGRLYCIDPQDNASDNASANVRDLGWYHPDGESYPASLFCIDGQQYLLGVTSRKGVPGFEWVWFDLEQRVSRTQPLRLPPPPDHGMQGILLYGTNTRDDEGNLYLAGCYKNADRSRQFPLLWKVSLSARAVTEEFGE